MTPPSSPQAIQPRHDSGSVACVQPAGSDGVGWFFSSVLVHDGTVIPLESVVIHRSEVGKFTA